MAYQVSTGERSLVHEFARTFRAGSGRRVDALRGPTLADGRLWGLMAEDDEWETVAFLVYDRQADQVVALRDMRGIPGVFDGIDHVTISPLGTYFLASFDRSCSEGQLGEDGDPCGLMVYDGSLQREGPAAHHRSLRCGPRRQQGEVAIFQDIDQDNISLLDWPVAR